MLQASAFLLSVTNTLVLTNTLAYYGIRRLRIRNVFIVQAPGAFQALSNKHSSLLLKFLNFGQNFLKLGQEWDSFIDTLPQFFERVFGASKNVQFG